MKESRFSEEHMAATLRQVNAGMPAAELTPALGISDQT
jgi:hypothetical protein